MDRQILSLEQRIQLRQALAQFPTLADKHASAEFIRDHVSTPTKIYHIHISFNDRPSTNLSNIINEFEKHYNLGGFLKAVLDNLSDTVDKTIVKIVSDSYEFVSGIPKLPYTITEEKD